MWKMKASTGFAALGCLLLLWTPMQAGDKGQPVAKEPGQAGEELIDLTGTAPPSVSTCFSRITWDAAGTRPTAPWSPAGRR